MLKRHEVEILLKAGHRKTEVARLAGVSLCSVKRIAQENPVVHVDEKAERTKRQIGRPSTVATFRNQIVQILQQEPDLASLEILRRMRGAGYKGGKTVLYELVASLRPKSAKPMVRFEGLPGEFSQHDFGEVVVQFLNGTRQRIHFFASRLKYSRAVRVSLVMDEKVEALVRTLAMHLASWGGRPLLCVFDRPKTIALEWGKNGVVTEWNSTFAYATLEMGVGVELCWPYRAQEKGSVENLVGFVKSSVPRESFPRCVWRKKRRDCDLSRYSRKTWPCGSRSMWVRPERLCMTGMPIPCPRRLSACRPRCTCMRSVCGSWPGDMKPSIPESL